MKSSRFFRRQIKQGRVFILVWDDFGGGPREREYQKKEITETLEELK